MLEIKNLNKIYKSKKGGETYALKDVNLKFGDKGLVFILGKSGSGKSTFLNVLGGLDSFDDGEIIINGKSSKEFSAADFDSYRNTYLGFVFQEFYILEDFSVKKNIELALQLQHKEGTWEEISALLKSVDLEGFENRKPNELSGGQKQRVAIARALIKNPNIILADEPTGALDSNTGHQVLETLRNLSSEKLVIIVSHDRDFADEFADRIIELKDGVIISDNTRGVVTHRAKGGITRVDQNTIKISKGHHLTEKELTEINEMMDSLDGEGFLTLSGKKEFQTAFPDKTEKAAKETKGAFLKTNQEEIVGDTKALTLIPSKLPFSDVFKLAASNFKAKRFRLIITLFLSVLSLVFFGFAVILSGYDRDDSYVKTYYEGNAYMISVNKTETINYSATNKQVIDIPFSEENLQYLEKRFEGALINEYKIQYAEANMLSGKKTVLDTAFYDNSSDPVFRPTEFGGIIEADATDLEIVFGNFPAVDTECCISDLFADYFIKLGMRIGLEDGSIVKLVVDNYSQILGKIITVGGNSYAISGIYKTNYYLYKDEFIGKSAATINSDSELTKIKTRYQEDYSMFMNKLLVRKGYAERFAKEQYFYPAALTLNPENDLNVTLGAKLERDSKYGLKQGEVYLSALYYKNVAYGYESTKTFAQLAADFASPKEFNFYIKASDIEESTDLIFSKNYKVVGIYDDIEILGTPTIVMNYYDFIEVVQQDYKPESVLISANLSGEDLKTLITDMRENEYRVTSRNDAALQSIESLMERFRTILYIVAIALAVFVTLLLYNFISVSISNKRKDIGILRALGARGVDVMQIFILEGAMLALIIIVISIPAVIVAAHFASLYLYSVLPVTLISFTPIVAIEMAALTLIIILLSSFFPVLGISRKKPIDAIKNK